MTDNPQTPTTDDAPAAPPWGDDFDAERAWTLVQNLREDVATMKAERNEARASAADAANAARERDEARAALWAERAMRTHSLPAESARFLTGDTEEAVTEKAAALALMRTTPAAHAEEETAPTPALPSRPTPALVPAHGATPPPPQFDAAAVARRGRRR